ncbi:MAG: MFS transporter [Coprococcus comes]
MIYYLYANAPAGLGFDKADAAQLISLYATVVGMTTIIGSYVCDRILGCRRSLLVARVTGFIGYTLLAFPLGVVGYAAAMGCMVFGSLFAGRCIETLIGKFYDENDGRRDSAFTISYVISNIGAAAPALAGVIAAKCGYHAAFALSAVLSFLGTVAYIATYKKFFGNIGLEPDDPLPADKKRSFVVKMLIVVAIVGTVLAVSFATGKLKISSFANVVLFPSLSCCLSCLHLLKQEDRKAESAVLCLLYHLSVTPLHFDLAINLPLLGRKVIVIFGVEIPAK